MNKILMIAATPFFSDRGCHIRIYNEIKYLNKNDVEVVLCTYHLGYNPPGIKAENIKRIVNIPWYKKITPGASWHKLYLDLLLLVLSYKEYRKIKPKIIHAHLYEGLFIAYIIKILSGFKAKIVFDCQGSLAEEMKSYTLNKNPLFKPFYYAFLLIEKILLFLPNITLCSSENSYNFIKSRYKIKDDKIDILNDGVDDDLFKEASPKERLEAQKAFGVPIGNKVILYTGSMSAAKGVKELLDAVPEILTKNNKISFVFAGYGDLEGEYREKYKNFIDSKNIFFVGRFSYFDLVRYTALADYAIDPKKGSSESSGKIFNYIFAGISVVCFKNDFNLSLLGNNGIYIESFISLQNLSSYNCLKVDKNHSFKISFIIKKLITIYSLL